MYEEERSLGNWSYDVIRVRVASYIIYYDILHTQFMQPEAVSYAFKLTAGTNRMTEEQCLRPSDRESCITQQERKRTTGWLAGHEIHLEIEDVLDKIKSLSFKITLFVVKIVKIC